MTTPICAGWRVAISAALDGEETPADPALLDAHLRDCASCRAFRDGAGGLADLSRRGRTDRPDPDGAERIVARLRAGPEPRGWMVLRGGLLVVAGQILLLSLPEMLTAGVGHDGRHAFSFSLTYALALVLVAVRPARARTVLPIAAALVASLSVTAVLDTANGDTGWVREAVHLPEVVSLYLVWRLSRRPPYPVGGEDRRGVRLAPVPPLDEPGAGQADRAHRSA